jgi:hypothetical protein
VSGVGQSRCVKWNPVEGIGSYCADIGFSFAPFGPRPPWRLEIRMYFSLVRDNPPRDLLLAFDDAIAFRWEEEYFGGTWLPDDLPQVRGPGTPFTFPLLIVEDSAWIEKLASRYPLATGDRAHYAFVSLNDTVEIIAGPPVRAEWIPGIEL